MHNGKALYILDNSFCEIMVLLLMLFSCFTVRCSSQTLLCCSHQWWCFSHPLWWSVLSLWCYNDVLLIHHGATWYNPSADCTLPRHSVLEPHMFLLADELVITLSGLDSRFNSEDPNYRYHLFMTLPLGLELGLWIVYAASPDCSHVLLIKSNAVNLSYPMQLTNHIQCS